jgi:hypothetical protein
VNRVEGGGAISGADEEELGDDHTRGRSWISAGPTCEKDDRDWARTTHEKEDEGTGGGLAR